MNNQLTDLLASDYLTSNVEQRVERTLNLNVSIKEVALMFCPSHQKVRGMSDVSWL